MEQEAGIALSDDGSGMGRAETGNSGMPRVAVIGVHGIARHPAGETENCMADLLLSLPGDGARGGKRYEPFRAVGIQIPLCPVITLPYKVGDEPEQPSAARSFVKGEEVPLKSGRSQSRTSSRELSAKFADYLQEPKGPKERLAFTDKPETQPGVDIAYTQFLLQGYEGGSDGNAYVTTRLEGQRKGGAEPAKVHIYEALWADLAHPESNLVGFFLSLFTLLFHLGSLSRTAIDTGAAESRGRVAGAYRWTHRVAVNILQSYLPVFKVLALCVVLAAIPGVSPVFSGSGPEHAVEDLHSKFLSYGLGVFGGILVVLAAYAWRSKISWWLPRSPWLWSASLLLPGAAGGLVAQALLFFLKNAQLACSILCWIFVGLPIVIFLLLQYGMVRAGVWTVGLVSYFAAFAAYVYFFFAFHDDAVSRASFVVLELLVGAIRVSWLSLSGLAILAYVLGEVAWWQHPKNSPERARMRAAVRTSRFALAMASVFFMLVTGIIWGALFKIAGLVRKPAFFAFTSDPNDNNHVLCFLAKMHVIPTWNASPFQGQDYFTTALAWGFGPQFPITVALVVLGLLILVWFVAPSAMLEPLTQRDEQKPPRFSTNLQSMRLGSWLSRGLDSTAVVTQLFWCSIFLSFPVVWILGLSHDGSRLETITLSLCGMTGAMGAVAVAALFKYGSSILETILDVDTYLRDSPSDETTRARIFERFVSTLRYVAQYRDENGRGYDKVVIVAHSLGSLISGDLLRFLRVAQSSGARDPQLDAYNFDGKFDGTPITIQLLTMGAPKRQLLNRFFPYLYKWVRPVPDNGAEPLPALQGPTSSIAANATPDPAELGVSRWVNVYRSGDYVGRSIWLDEWYGRTAGGPQQGMYPQAIHAAQDARGHRVEMCIGAGAHTRYWDDTAPDVAEMLDRMIQPG